MEGTVKKGTPIRMMATGAEEEVVEVGYFGAGQFIPCDELAAGMVGYITASIKNVRDTRVGDTVTDSSNHVQRLCQVTRKLHLWFTADCILQTVQNTMICVMHWKSCS